MEPTWLRMTQRALPLSRSAFWRGGMLLGMRCCGGGGAGAVLDEEAALVVAVAAAALVLAGANCEKARLATLAVRDAIAPRCDVGVGYVVVVMMTTTMMSEIESHGKWLLNLSLSRLAFRLSPNRARVESSRLGRLGCLVAVADEPSIVRPRNASTFRFLITPTTTPPSVHHVVQRRGAAREARRSRLTLHPKVVSKCGNVSRSYRVGSGHFRISGAEQLGKARPWCVGYLHENRIDCGLLHGRGGNIRFHRCNGS